MSEWRDEELEERNETYVVGKKGALALNRDEEEGLLEEGRETYDWKEDWKQRHRL